MTPHDAPTHEAPPLQHLQELVAHLSQDAAHPDISPRRGSSEATVRWRSRAIFERLGVVERPRGARPALVD